MKIFKIMLFISFFASFLHAQSFFVLSGIKNYYPVVEINSDKIDQRYKGLLLDMLLRESKKIGIDTKNFSSRSLAFLVSFLSVGDAVALKIELLLGENVLRSDTKEEIFVISYMSSRIFVPEELGSELLENAEEMLNTFTTQYKEDNL